MRECGECNACCDRVEVTEGDFHKPAGELCGYCRDGCSLYGKAERPKVCSAFQCAWLRGYGGEEDRPDKNHTIVSISEFNGGRWIFAIDLAPNAFMLSGHRILQAVAEEVHLPIIVSDYATPIGEDYGDYVILQDVMKRRAKQIMGRHLAKFGEHMHVYELVVG